MAAGRAGAQPLAVADDHVVGAPLALNSVKALVWKSDHGVVSTVTLTPVSWCTG